MRTIVYRPSIWPLVALVLGCSSVSEDQDADAPKVLALPGGRTFEGSLEVRLLSDPPGPIFFTLDGASPHSSDAQPYSEPLRLTSSILLSFVAFEDETGLWSPLGVELYERAERLPPLQPPLRGLEVSDDVLFFAAGEYDERLTKEVVIKSVGREPVRIDRIYIDAQGAYFEPGVFELEFLPHERLSPGREMTIQVTYNVTMTLRTAELVIESNDMRASEGTWVVTLGGRRLTW